MDYFCWQLDSSSSSQEISAFYKTRRFHHRVHNNSPLVPVLSHINQVSTFICNIFMIQFRMLLSSHFQWWSLPLTLTNQNFAFISHLTLNLAGEQCKSWCMSVLLSSGPNKLSLMFFCQPLLVPENCVYALGGFDSTNYQASVERFDPRMGRWFPVPSMSSRRSSCGVAPLDGALYCIGGNDGTMCMSSGERFNIRRNAWEPISSMLSRR